MTTLEEVTTSDLVDELKRRYPVMVFAGSTSFTEETDLDVAAWNGPLCLVNFLLDIMKSEVMDDYLDTAHDLEELS